ncbi:DUF2313 domain-containing protein [Azospirillum brasilense]|uniref:DUF2313 domain-containing protein n=1 Tax=Azospirillum brasilense TaxID=192 RepID=A0A4D8QUZ6_AZOBR|nr:YmfQ family protein [Azospirillum brasilense]QCO13987.1 DUF2313 domain-containing protein [Azospirillum brasilense]
MGWTFTRADFRSALQALLPRGRAWPRDAGTVQWQVLDGLAAVYERQTADAAALLVDAFPATATLLLPEWEASLGLPDACTGPAVGLAERRRRVVSKLIDTGGQSRSYFIGLADSMGYPGCTITEFAPFSVGSPCSAALNTAEAGWPHAWRLNAPISAGSYPFTANSGCDEALAAWGSALLECVIRRAAPAHSAVLFGYRPDLDLTDATGVTRDLMAGSGASVDLMTGDLHGWTE